MNITYTSNGNTVTANITASGERFALWVESSDGRAAAKTEDTIAELIEYLLYAYPEDATCICGASLIDGECPRAQELDASLRAEVSDGDAEKLPRVFPDEVFMPDDYVPMDDIDFDGEW